MPAGSTVLIACSGGADSLALLVGMAELAPRLDLRLVVAHLDHGLRPGSEADARSVLRRAETLGLPFLSERIAARRRMRERGLSGEAGLRVLRREFLLAAAAEAGADFITLAHTADDQAETLLLRLVRGTGVRGLGAMRWRHGRWMRPLLGVTREAVREFLRSRKMRARLDPSNRDRRLARNYVRLEIMPRLRRLNPQANLALAATAERVRGISTVLDRLGKRALQNALAPHRGPGIRLVRKILVGYHPSIRESVIRQAWVLEQPHGAGLTRRHLRDIEALLARGVGGSRVSLPDKRVARLERGHLFLGSESRTRPGSNRGRTQSAKKRKTR
jgi:tRNA(Ile)-lysidine synthase